MVQEDYVELMFAETDRTTVDPETLLDVSYRVNRPDSDTPVEWDMTIEIDGIKVAEYQNGFYSGSALGFEITRTVLIPPDIGTGDINCCVTLSNFREEDTIPPNRGEEYVVWRWWVEGRE